MWGRGAALVQRFFAEVIDFVVSFHIGSKNSFSEIPDARRTTTAADRTSQSWQACVRSTAIHAISLAHYAFMYARAKTQNIAFGSRAHHSSVVFRRSKDRLFHGIPADTGVFCRRGRNPTLSQRPGYRSRFALTTMARRPWALSRSVLK